jgi:hypothetical protein
MQALKLCVASHAVGGSPAFVGRDDILQNVYDMSNLCCWESKAQLCQVQSYTLDSKNSSKQ